MDLTSDLHFFHKNICKYCPDSRGQWYTDDPSKLEENLRNMNEMILKQFDDLPDNSTIFNLGDLVISSKISFEDIKLLVDRMKKNNKHLWILLGNHDRSLNRYLGPYKFQQAEEIFYKLGFERVFTAPLIIKNYIFSHEPVYIESNANIINIHGHTHNIDVDRDYFSIENAFNNKKFFGKEVDPNAYINVCWDKVMNFVPFNLEDINAFKRS